jgi:L-aminopeptidase/D-esterase-like protein
MSGSITDIPGIAVGHAQDKVVRTGCTVILCPEGAVAGADVRGSAPGTRELEVLKPVRLVQEIQAIALCGGSAFGLDVASGVQRYLREQQKGFDTGIVRVPIVPAAVIFDLGVGDASAFPDASMGYQACLSADTGWVAEGPVGVGCGATVGKVRGPAYAEAGGVGSCSHRFHDGTAIGVLTVVNAFGQVIDPDSGSVMAGVLDDQGTGHLDAVEVLAETVSYGFPGGNTTLSVVATDASLTREQAIKVSQMAQNGLGRAIRPAHTLYDGDIVFTLSTGQKPADVTLLGAVACDLVAESVLRGVSMEPSS